MLSLAFHSLCGGRYVLGQDSLGLYTKEQVTYMSVSRPVVVSGTSHR